MSNVRPVFYLIYVKKKNNSVEKYVSNTVSFNRHKESRFRYFQSNYIFSNTMTDSILCNKIQVKIILKKSYTIKLLNLPIKFRAKFIFRTISDLCNIRLLLQYVDN